jgi:undecaprenyl-diphosphatase
MSVTLAVVVAALIAATAIWAMSRSAGSPDPIDPEAEERWLVRMVEPHPRLGAVVRRIDRDVAGGVMLVGALVIVFTTAVIVGSVFDMVDRQRGLARWDQAVAEWGSEHASTWSTNLLDALTDLGGTAILVLVVVAVSAYDYWRHRNVNVVLFLVAVLLGVVLLNNGLKLIVDRERPDVPHLVEAAGSSFPSGHSSAAAAAWCAVALVVARHSSRRVRAIAAAAAAMVAIAVAASRALLGVHWLTDVVAGVLVGWGWFLLCALAFGGRLQRLGEPAERSAVATAATVGPDGVGVARPRTARGDREDADSPRA